jgi:hypothetical protein
MVPAASAEIPGAAPAPATVTAESEPIAAAPRPAAPGIPVIEMQPAPVADATPPSPGTPSGAVTPPPAPEVAAGSTPPTPLVPTPPADGIPPLAIPETSAAELEAAAQALEDLFSESAATLAGLDSYRYTTVFSFTGEESGELESGSVEVRGTVASADRQSMTWTELETGEVFSLIRVGDRAWMREGEEWAELPEMVADAVSQGLLIYAPVAGWSLFAEELQAKSTLVGTETVNGIAAAHYASTYSSLPEEWGGDVSSAQGDVWIAEQGFPVRYRLTATMVDDEGVPGTVLWTMELSDVNAPLVVEPPQE